MLPGWASGFGGTTSGAGRRALARIRSIALGSASKVARMLIRGARTVICLATGSSVEELAVLAGPG